MPGSGCFCAGCCDLRKDIDDDHTRLCPSLDGEISLFLPALTRRRFLFGAPDRHAGARCLRRDAHGDPRAKRRAERRCRRRVRRHRPRHRAPRAPPGRPLPRLASTASLGGTLPPPRRAAASPASRALRRRLLPPPRRPGTARAGRRPHRRWGPVPSQPHRRTCPARPRSRRHRSGRVDGFNDQDRILGSMWSRSASCLVRPAAARQSGRGPSRSSVRRTIHLRLLPQSLTWSRPQKLSPDLIIDIYRDMKRRNQRLSRSRRRSRHRQERPPSACPGATRRGWM